MPILKLSHAKPADAQMKERLIRRLTEVVVEEMQVPPSAVNVLLEYVEAECWGVGGESLQTIFSRREA